MPQPSQTEGKEGKLYTLQRESELRFEVNNKAKYGNSTSSNSKDADVNAKLTITLVNGTAEIFGAELLVDKPYVFGAHSKMAVFTWHGCSLRVSGSQEMVYASRETPMVSYINTHGALDSLRTAAKQNNVNGPRTLIVGGADVGKSTLARCLLNYAVRAGYKPLFCDVDVGKNSIGIPGSVAATPIEHVIEPRNVLGPRLKSVISCYYGHLSPRKSIELYKTLCQELVTSINKRIAQGSPETKASGLIVKTCGWAEGRGYKLLVDLTLMFNIDVVLVLGNERLYNQLKNNSELKSATVARLNKSTGVVTQTPSMRRAVRHKVIHQYFYGVDGDLSPHQKVLDFSEVNIFEGGLGSALSDSMLPQGQKALLDPSKPVPVSPSADLLQKILAVSYAQDPESLLKQNIAGFVYVTAVDTVAQTITVLSPSTGRLPSNLLISGTVQWSD